MTSNMSSKIDENDLPSSVKVFPFAKPLRPLKSPRPLYPHLVQVRIVEESEKEGL